MSALFLKQATKDIDGDCGHTIKAGDLLYRYSEPATRWESMHTGSLRVYRKVCCSCAATRGYGQSDAIREEAARIALEQ